MLPFRLPVSSYTPYIMTAGNKKAEPAMITGTTYVMMKSFKISNLSASEARRFCVLPEIRRKNIEANENRIKNIEISNNMNELFVWGGVTGILYLARVCLTHTAIAYAVLRRREKSRGEE